MERTPIRQESPPNPGVRPAGANDFPRGLITKANTQNSDEMSQAEKLCEAEETPPRAARLSRQASCQSAGRRRSYRPTACNRRLMAQAEPLLGFDLEEGILESRAPDACRDGIRSRLSPSSRRRTRSSRQLVVTLLIDNSGSMRGRPITRGRHTVPIFFARTDWSAAASKVREILAFTNARPGRGGQSSEHGCKRATAQSPAPQTICATIIYKPTDAPGAAPVAILG